jgi:Asp-tRNA(Asn)/Glu-tRNA(Gln) amidotransferase B subunit
VNDLSACIATNCPQGSPNTCSCMVQCAQDGLCRALNEMCVGQSPDPDCMVQCGI